MRFYISLIFTMVIVFFLSCEGKNNKRKRNFDISDFLIDLPDSIQIDSPITGLLEYKLSDSPLLDKKFYKRYNFLYATISNKRISSFNELKNMPHDTFVTIEENIIPIYNMKSLEKGNVLFNGFLCEQFFYKISEDSVRIITKERRFEKTIKVY